MLCVHIVYKPESIILCTSTSTITTVHILILLCSVLFILTITSKNRRGKRPGGGKTKYYSMMYFSTKRIASAYISGVTDLPFPDST